MSRFSAQFLNPQWLRIVFAWIAVLAPLVLFGAISEEVWEGESFQLDDPTLMWLRANSHPSVDGFMLFVSRIGGGVLLWAGAVAAIALARASRYREAAFIVLAIGGAGLLNLLAKWCFARTRPFLWPSLAPETGFSFPSGHAMLSSAFAVTVLVLLWRSTERWPVRILALISGLLFVASVGTSRLYLGVHYPSDIMAGWLASAAWVGLVRVVMPKF